MVPAVAVVEAAVRLAAVASFRGAARSGAGQPPAPASPISPPKRPQVRHHHDECDKMLYEGGACTCDLIEHLGPPSEREDSY
ncbi:hypothetical protein G5C60_37420 [Streptomyces sp. HC44]|uniref:Uncharacterized protein n=1 Tax=Streptomyces scabichelini TaxID=2711217 RepID=A0A6G4VG56_9ACTN|nr:hypothetical protein [Streptomyces scabichelini]NGO13128.1 hypothetical protein [Streptomyces scabichelini]